MVTHTIILAIWRWRMGECQGAGGGEGRVLETLSIKKKLGMALHAFHPSYYRSISRRTTALA
jgi:hypothetical protein